jgi:hypothetical protein
MLFLIPINLLKTNQRKKLQAKILKENDSRIKLINQILVGIKCIKFYGWEESFKQMVDRIRSNEIRYLIKSAAISCFSNFMWDCTPFFVSVISFGTYIFFDERNILDPVTAFVSLSLFDIIKFPLNVFPMVVGNLIQVI